MTRGSYKRVPVPGVMPPSVAFDRAAKLVKEGHFDQARELKPYMVPTDAGLIEQRIAERSATQHESKEK